MRTWSCRRVATASASTSAPAPTRRRSPRAQRRPASPSSRAPTSMPTAGAPRACAWPSPRSRPRASARASSASARSSPSSVPLDDLLAGNRAWAADVVQRDPGFLRRLESLQSPRYLLLGCSDSRVPANQINRTDPGDVFDHRNVANVVVHTDLNCLSVLQYAIEVLKVEHVVVCGHYGCGGGRAAYF